MESMEAGPVDDGRGIGVGSEEVPAENNTTQDAERPDHATRTTAAATNRTFLPPTTSLCDHYCLSSPIVKRKLTFWLPLESQKGQISIRRNWVGAGITYVETATTTLTLY